MNKQEIEKAISHLKMLQKLDARYSKKLYDTAITALEHQLTNMWIPVSKRLPTHEEYLKDDGRFIVTDGNRRYQAWFDIYDGYFAIPKSRDEILSKDKCVTHWQPLPEPWKETV